LGDRFEDINSISSVLVSRLEYPVVAADKVAVGHYVFGCVFFQKHLPDAWAFVLLDVIQPFVNLCETQKIEISSIYI